jgi:hypothetical protein
MIETDDMRKEALSIVLLAFLVVIAVYVWSLNLLTQERVFGFLISAELIVFAMLTYTYYKQTFDELNKTLLLMACLAVIDLLIFSTVVLG